MPVSRTFNATLEHHLLHQYILPAIVINNNIIIALRYTMDIFVNIITLTDEEVPGAKLPNEPGKCSVMQLERWLECRGQRKTGKMFDLAERVRACMPLNIDLKVDGGF